MGQQLIYGNLFDSMASCLEMGDGQDEVMERHGNQSRETQKQPLALHF